jgi:hypothetical protein
LSQTQACLRIGRAISDTGSKTGFQNAVTPPKSVNWALLTYIGVVAIIGYQGWAFGLLAAGITFAVMEFRGHNTYLHILFGAWCAERANDIGQWRRDPLSPIMHYVFAIRCPRNSMGHVSIVSGVSVVFAAGV